METEELKKKLEEWGCEHVQEFKVTLGRHHYVGCKYVQTNTFLYVLGELPKSWRFGARRVFGDCETAVEWFVAGYMTDDILSGLEEDMKHLHPFGPYFLLSPWTHSKPVDYGEAFPYQRIAMVQELVL